MIENTKEHQLISRANLFILILRNQQYTPQRFAPVQIISTHLEDKNCTHEKMDCSSLRSMAQYAGAEMAKARIYEDLPARDSKSIGGFKHVHVRL
jgi:hypothetical protein